MAERLTFDLNNGDIKVWEQDGHDGDVSLYTMVDNWERNNKITIPAGDMVMLGNLYREIKEQDIKNPFLNYYGKNKLTTGEDISAALRKQIPMKLKNERSDGVVYAAGLVCPNCEGYIAYTTRITNYCCQCGQALDWSDYQQ